MNTLIENFREMLSERVISFHVSKIEVPSLELKSAPLPMGRGRGSAQGYNPELANIDTFESKMGGMWAHALGLTNLPADGCVVEVAPGNTPKVGIGLQRLGFEGTLYVVDPCGSLLDEVVAKYRTILPRTTVVPVLGTLTDAPRLITQHVDALIANHPMDDLLVGKYLENSQTFQKFFLNNYLTPNPEDRRKLWETIDSDESAVETAKAEVVDEWMTTIDAFNPGAVIIAQYHSYYFQSNQLYSPDVHAFNMLRSLQSKMGEDNCSQEIVLDPGSIDEPDRWLLARKDGACCFEF